MVAYASWNIQLEYPRSGLYKQCLLRGAGARVDAEDNDLRARKVRRAEKARMVVKLEKAY